VAPRRPHTRTRCGVWMMPLHGVVPQQGHLEGPQPTGPAKVETSASICMHTDRYGCPSLPPIFPITRAHFSTHHRGADRCKGWAFPISIGTPPGD
jgi:hypothetical protein